MGGGRWEVHLQQTSVHQVMAVATHSRKGYSYLPRISFVCLFVCLFAYLFVCLLICLFVYICLFCHLCMVNRMTEAGTARPIMAWVEGIPYSRAHCRVTSLIIVIVIFLIIITIIIIIITTIIMTLDIEYLQLPTFVSSLTTGGMEGRGHLGGGEGGGGG